MRLNIFEKVYKRIVRFELTRTVWKTENLPLIYMRIKLSYIDKTNNKFGKNSQSNSQESVR